MITKMTKYSFVLLRTNTPEFLAHIQELGMVDINREDKPVDTQSKDWSDRIQQFKQCIAQLQSLTPPAEPIPYLGTADALVEEVSHLTTLCENHKNDVATLSDFIALAMPWGPFTKDDTDQIQQLGMTLHAYVVPEKKFNPQWEQEFPLQVINRLEGRVYFVVLETPNPDVPYAFPVTETPFPNLPYTVLEERRKNAQTEWDACQTRLEQLASNVPLLKAEVDRRVADLDRYLAGASCESGAEGYLSILTGFIPTSQTAMLNTLLDKESLYYESAPADLEDNPPVKLKNNWFARLFEPIGDLYMLPTYNELDLTPYFAPFYMLFFGLCLGDMGYGLLLMLLGIVGKRFAPKMKNYLNLVLLLGFGTVLMGSLSGVFFGTKVSDWLPAVKSQNFIFMMSDMSMFWFAILFGLFQIIFARIMHGIDMCIRKGWQYGMSSFGWAILIIWCTLAYASTSVPALSLPKNVSLVLVILSVILILFFSKPEGPIYKRVGPGLWAMYDITGVFGDMLSYIRLFGLGTAGGILGMVMNQIALSLSGIPYIGWLFTVIVLLFGHSLVLGLNVLGAFVHPLRLTFVEFYKNASFSGGGRAFKPLKK